MHELRIADDLTRIVLTVAADHGLTLVSVVNVQLGEMVQIVPDMLKIAFEETSRGTIASQAGLEIEILPLRVRCQNCDIEASLTKFVVYCPTCKSETLDIVQGNEIQIKSIEGE